MFKEKLNGGLLTIADKVIIELIHHKLSSFSPLIKPYHGIQDLFSERVKRKGKKGVYIITENSSFDLLLKLSILYGADSCEVGRDVQQAIYDDIKNITGKCISAINVQFEAVHFDD